MRGLPNLNPADRKFWPKEPEPGFSPAKNKWVIDNSIKKYEANRARKMKQFKDGLGERVDAVTRYLIHLGGRSTPIMRYFGKSNLARLRGQKIINKLKRTKGNQASVLKQRVWDGEGTYLGNPSKEKSGKEK